MNEDKKNKSSYWVLLLLLIPIGIYFTASYIQSEDYKEISKVGIETVGVIYDKGADAYKMRYYADGKEFNTGGDEPFEYLQDGEEYVVKYMPDDPEKMFVDFNRPVLSNDFVFDSTICLSIEKTLSICKFQYNVSGELLTRNLYYKDNQSLNPSDYLVKYRTDNPSISYLVRKFNTEF